MKLVTITANSAAEALAEIHRKLGPDAVIVNVRKTPAPGLGGLFKKPQVEVQAAVPERQTRPAPQQQRSASSDKQAWVDLHKKVTQLKKQLDAAPEDPESPQPRRRVAPEEPSSGAKPEDYAAKVRASLREARRKRELDGNRNDEAPARQGRNASRADRSARPVRADDSMPDLGGLLESLGILPLHAQWLVDQVRAWQGNYKFENLREEFAAVQELLIEYWNRLQAKAAVSAKGSNPTRILVGAPGVGKTTCICKWLTQEVLLQNQRARVWRIDTHTANTAEFLSIHGEILGVPVERVWTNEPVEKVPLQFVDLPGVATDDPDAIAALKPQINNFKPAQVLLVLNAAYDLDHLMAQARAFSVLPLSGLILTHIDEETRWSKFWNLFLGTKLPMAFLSGGQNIPGNFYPATPQALFDVEME